MKWLKTLANTVMNEALQMKEKNIPGWEEAELEALAYLSYLEDYDVRNEALTRMSLANAVHRGLHHYYNDDYDTAYAVQVYVKAHIASHFEVMKREVKSSEERERLTSLYNHIIKGMENRG